jgi:2,4-dienoyl-CoA reductase-like NADH-dependent reductase (Old Yellow Enzyme family)
MRVYYAQRASKGGFMLTEAAPVHPTGHGYPCTPGLHTDDQLKAWKPIVEAVHAKGAVFFTQLWHVGRASHQEYQPGKKAPVAPSALAITDPAWTVYGPTGSGPHPYPVPRVLDAKEIGEIVAAFGASAKRAVTEAGFDGVEVHSANGYLLNQFLCDGTNQRKDNYGGSIENRCRLTLDVMKAVIAAVGDSKKVGIRLAPFNMFLQCTDSNPEALYSHLIKELNALNLGYVHFIMPRQFEPSSDKETAKLYALAAQYTGTKLLAGGFDAKTGAAALAAGHGHAIVYGRHYLSNPDLPKRFAVGAKLNDYDRATFYDPTAGDKGYTDYPFLGQTKTEGVPSVDPYAVKAAA